METIVYKLDSTQIDLSIIKKAAEVIKDGGLVAFPTETVYGIGANALDIKAIKNIFIAKGRPSDNPLIVHISDKEDVYKYVKNVGEKAQKLMKAFWPGPLTLIFEKNELIPKAITGGLNTVAIRMPDNLIARELIRTSELPIAAPSANVSGKPSPTLAKHVIQDLKGKVNVIIDGGSSNIGLESTVIDVSTNKPLILRPGGITEEMIREVIGEVEMDPSLFKESTEELAPRSPGMKYRHYAPNAVLTIVEGSIDRVIEKINELTKEEGNKGKKVGVIATTQTKHKYICDNTLVIGDENKPQEIAANLFKVLREFDELDVDIIYSQVFSKENIGIATMNRLLKAAGYKIVSI